ncbi:hypothetical protein ACGFZ7_16495 [Pseudomonas sp. NPDC047963]|nr:hypothetical protein [Pseudomonas sp.]
MACYSIDFVHEVLRDRDYQGKFSKHLLKQMYNLDCDQLSRLMRSLDELELAKPLRHKKPRAFKGALAGYMHYHYRRNDWLAANFSASLGGDVGDPLDLTLDLAAESLFTGGADLDRIAANFKKRMNGAATGDWIIYIVQPHGNYYLALSEHVDSGSQDETDLGALLSDISTSKPVVI